MRLSEVRESLAYPVRRSACKVGDAGVCKQLQSSKLIGKLRTFNDEYSLQHMCLLKLLRHMCIVKYSQFLLDVYIHASMYANQLVSN